MVSRQDYEEGSPTKEEDVMKKLHMYTTRGQVPDNTEKRIQLFDGRFDTAFRVVDFRVWGSDANASDSDVASRLSTEELGVPTSPDIFDASDNRQIGWASSEMDTALGAGNWQSIVDPDNLIVEDLFIWANDSANDPINYMITLEKYDITEWKGALAMVRNRSQA
ncbi:MAG: hypothetical protein [Circular genetic element sp.]|nr:MAG: hypothetical protein [Circular genetic element sp.]